MAGLSRLGLWSEIAAISVVEPILIAAYERESIRDQIKEASPHGHPWFTSFHASAFPGDNPVDCARAAVYGLMGLPSNDLIEPKLRAWFELGTNLEHAWVRHFAADGVLLSKDVTAGDDYQTSFADPEYWLTGASDAIILPAFWRKGHCVEVKTTSHEKVMAMRDNPVATPKQHGKYVRQLKTYISLANEAPFTPEIVVCSESWAITKGLPIGDLRWCPVHESVTCATEEVALEPPDDGTLIYSSREEPLTTASYYINLDEEHMIAGRARLAEYRQAFIDGVIPAHPRETESKKWSVEPCQWCSLKSAGCKKDYTDKVTDLAASNLIATAMKIDPNYSYETARAQVLGRWETNG